MLHSGHYDGLTLTLASARARVFNDGLWEAQVTACYSVPKTADGETAGTASIPYMHGVCADAKTGWQWLVLPKRICTVSR